MVATHDDKFSVLFSRVLYSGGVTLDGRNHKFQQNFLGPDKRLKYIYTFRYD